MIKCVVLIACLYSSLIYLSINKHESGNYHLQSIDTMQDIVIFVALLLNTEHDLYYVKVFSIFIIFCNLNYELCRICVTAVDSSIHNH